MNKQLIAMVAFFGLAWAINVQAVVPTDGWYDYQWYLKRIKANLAWDIKSESPQVVVAVIDTGCQLDHPDLKDNFWINIAEIPNNGRDDDHNGYIDDYHGYDFVNREAEPTPKFKAGFTEDGVVHGTVVSGVLAATGNNRMGISGVTWKAQIMCLKALNDKGEASTPKVIEAIDYAVRKGAHIINLSFIGAGYDKAMEAAITRAYKAGVMVVAPGGNELSDGHGQDLDKTPMYPVCYDGKGGENMVIGVAATGPLDEKMHFSGFGKKCIDLTAPGVSIFSTSLYQPNNSGQGPALDQLYDGYWSGTSFAVPMVSGALALLMQVNPELTPSELKEILFQTADNINISNLKYVNLLGAGRLNVDEAIKEAWRRHAARAVRLVVANYNEPGWIKIVSTADGSGTEFKAFDKNLLNITTGDLDGDGQVEIIATPAGGAKPEVKIFNRDGKLLKTWLVWDSNYRGGLSISAADVNGDGKAELMVAPLGSVKPEVKIFAWPGKQIKRFAVFGNNFRGGVNVSAGDLDGLGEAEIVVMPASKGGPQVRLFNGEGKLMGQFFAFDASYRSGWNITVSQVHSAWRWGSALIISDVKGGGSYVQLFNSRYQAFGRFMAFDNKFSGGVVTAAVDIDGDGQAEIIAGTGVGSAPNITIYQANGRLIKSFFVGASESRNGVSVAILPI
ncbi:hypothetical protein COT94_01325 [Candidatus Falkowbacteria bacterium CG10_big_fil_rev_8_21_14_0_10_37_14]|uniref:Peptidase S8/S53 domain-containing protein n=1 Tax=Candidatus Falkowbacteria bacterium CG10_big_fil_rev_8_21_14_0_10_37_14 TaxID=1974561 RepID=A0A2M6WUA8_9BACT|nr:S8 family serine peptidase [Candidatus Falkowbacteria bacterium]PIT96316.1 MAG: hypothetical protein COT94_01325 [Candidatus Falkowbacteria bacterium CG10_big_fil_rev_8_21_14_0_10_37_14]